MTSPPAGRRAAGPLRAARPLLLPFTAAPWRAAGYLASYAVAGSALFAVSLAAVLAGVVATQFTVTLPLVTGTVWVLRGCAQVERARAVLVDEPIPYHYREVTEPGLAARIRTRCTDPASIRDCACLVLLYPLLLVLDVAALGVWLVLLAGITLPLWYSSLSAAAGGKTGGGWSVLRVGTLPQALLAAAVCLVLFLLAAHLVVAAARAHLAVARALLRPPRDPLAQAKRVLATAGPLSGVVSRVPLPTRSDKDAHEPEHGTAH